MNLIISKPKIHIVKDAFGGNAYVTFSTHISHLQYSISHYSIDEVLSEWRSQIYKTIIKSINFINTNKIDPDAVKPSESLNYYEVTINGTTYSSFKRIELMIIIQSLLKNDINLLLKDSPKRAKIKKIREEQQEQHQF